MKKAVSIHIDIAELVFVVSKIPQDKKAEWLDSFVETLVLNNNSNFFASKLLKDVEEYQRVKGEKARLSANARWHKEDNANGCERIQSDTNVCEPMRSDANYAKEQNREEQNREEYKEKDTIVSKKKDKPSGLLDVYFEFIILGINPNKAKDKAVDFYNYYNSNGWKVNRNPMKDWKAAAAGTWMKSEIRSDELQREKLREVAEKLKELYGNDTELDFEDINRLMRSNPDLFEDTFLFPESWKPILRGEK